MLSCKGKYLNACQVAPVSIAHTIDQHADRRIDLDLSSKKVNERFHTSRLFDGWGTNSNLFSLRGEHEYFCTCTDVEKIHVNIRKFRSLALGHFTRTVGGEDQKQNFGTRGLRTV